MSACPLNVWNHTNGCICTTNSGMPDPAPAGSSGFGSIAGDPPHRGPALWCAASTSTMSARYDLDNAWSPQEAYPADPATVTWERAVEIVGRARADVAEAHLIHEDAEREIKNRPYDEAPRRARADAAALLARAQRFGEYAKGIMNRCEPTRRDLDDSAANSPIRSSTSEVMVQRVERARERYWDFRCIDDITSTAEEAAAGDGGFDEADVAYAVLTDDRDDDGGRCSSVTFYDSHGEELSEGFQSGYVTHDVPAEFLADKAPGQVARLGAIDMNKVRSYDFDRAARDYAREVREATDAMLAARAEPRVA